MTTLSGVSPWSHVVTRHRNEPRPWVVLHDPSGDFAGNFLRADDVSSHLAAQPWPDGMIVWHSGRGEVRIWRRGKWDILSPKKKGEA